MPHRSRVRIAAFSFLLAMTLHATSVRALTVYGDSLVSGWEDWSWGGTTRSFSNATPVHGGSASIAVTFTSGWSGLQLGRGSALDVTGLDTLRFFVHGGSAGGQHIEVQIGNHGNGAFVVRALDLQAGGWTQIDLSLVGLGTSTVDYIHWFDATAGALATFYVDDVSLLASGAPTPTPIPPGAGPALSVDVTRDRHAISPYIYGMNFADEPLAAELRLPVRRWGGNSTSRYNWQNDTSNRASDWYFENIPNDNANPGALPNGSSSDQFIDQDRRTGTATLMTVPLIGWTPKDRTYRCGFGVAKYGAQQSTDPWRPDCGNGVRANGSDVTGNDPTDTSVAITPTFVQQWMQHVNGKYGTAANGGVRFYNLDNEPMLWWDTHRDVHPQPTSYDEVRDRTYAYAAAMKAVDPAAQTLGPVLWGWSAYFWSALDSAPGGDWWNHPQDRLAHGNVPFVPWYLQQMRAYELQHGVRILDYLDLHNYPQASGVSLSPAGSATTQALRLRSTRSLWDAGYVDESWIAEPVMLIPRMKEWVGANYPGTKLAITEYNWGALDHINGAIAQADVLGIFGREGLDLATLWDPPSTQQPGAFAFRMYRNYDGIGGQFGDTAVRATSTDQERLSVYAAERSSDSALTLMIVNKSTQSLQSRVNVSGRSGVARVYRYDAANLTSVVRAADVAVDTAGFDATFPASSITLVVLSSSSAPSPSNTPTATIPVTRTPTRTSTATQVPTNTTIATSTSTRVPTATSTAIAQPTNTTTSTSVPSATFTATATRTPTNTLTATRTRTPTLTPLPTRTRTPTKTRRPRG